MAPTARVKPGERRASPPPAHRLARLLDDAARGRFSISDGLAEVLPAPPGPAMAVVGLSGHHVVASAAPEEWVREQLPDGVLRAPLGPRFLAALGDKLGRRDDGVDMLLAAPGLTGDARLQEVSGEGHPRVVRANAHRENVRAYRDAGGAVTVVLGRGLARRLEVAVEVEPEARCQGNGREALMDARRLVGPARLR